MAALSGRGGGPGGQQGVGQVGHSRRQVAGWTRALLLPGRER
jgi:hypothetical protein